MCVCSVAQSCLTLCDPMDFSLPFSSVHGILQARKQKWVAICLSRGSSQPRYQTHITCHSGIAGRFFTAAPPCLIFNCMSISWFLCFIAWGHWVISNLGPFCIKRLRIFLYTYCDRKNHSFPYQEMEFLGLWAWIDTPKFSKVIILVYTLTSASW